jgi:mono/diheme cytochrome c family protein
MPPFRGHLTNQQIADVVNYVRKNFGNRLRGEVKPEDVQALR